jgi:hypothetical protein
MVLDFAFWREAAQQAGVLLKERRYAGPDDA